MAATGTRGVGRLYIWDARHRRILVYEKADGSYVEQFVAAEGEPEFNDVRGLIVVELSEAEPPILVWADTQRLYRTVLEATPEASPEPSPGETSEPSPRVTPTGPTPEPSERPRRTPRETPQP